MGRGNDDSGGSKKTKKKTQQPVATRTASRYDWATNKRRSIKSEIKRLEVKMRRVNRRIHLKGVELVRQRCDRMESHVARLFERMARVA